MPPETEDTSDQLHERLHVLQSANLLDRNTLLIQFVLHLVQLVCCTHGSHAFACELVVEPVAER